MRILLSSLVILGLAGPVLAAHENGTPPGQIAATGTRDLNGDGKTNGADYAPGQSAEAEPTNDRDGDGQVNGRDYAPGQIPRR